MKKVRSYVDVEENSDGVDMDVDQVSVADGKMREGDVRIPSLASEQVHHVVSQEGDGASYASEFPKKNPQEKDSDELHTDLCSETNLYGEWMMVQQRRRGSSNMPRLNPAENRGKSVMAEANGNMGNMRARVVQSQREDKRKKKVNAKPLKSVEVIPTMNGSKSTVVTHHPVICSDSHAAVRIVEDFNTGITPARDRNTKYFHARVKEWCRRNCISALRRADDSWATAPSELTSIALKFYRNLFTSEGNITDSYSTRGLFPHVNRVALEHDYDPMSDIEVRRLPICDDVPVAAMVVGNGEWKWNELEQLLLPHVLLHLVAIKCPLPSFSTDDVTWAMKYSGKFTVKSAYGVCAGIEFGPEEDVWQLIHKFWGTQRMKMFLWMHLRFGRDPRGWDLIFGATCWYLWLYRNGVSLD
ncbi:hypothetical protein V6N13_148416 [Hibiscus sabdariffa]